MTRREALAEIGVLPEATGAIYFIQAGDDGPIKIGHSNDPFGRLANLQTGHYDKLHLRGLATGNVEVERLLHERFAHLRLEGEWFTADSAILEAVEHPAEWIADVLDALEGVAALPLRIVQRVKLGDREHALIGLLAVVLAAKSALDALGVTTAEAQIRLDQFFTFVDELGDEEWAA